VTDTRFNCPGGTEGSVDPDDSLHTEMVYPTTNDHLSWHVCLERSSCRRHFSTFSVYFPKTFKTTSLFTLLSWPYPL